MTTDPGAAPVSGPIIVGVEGSDRSRDPLALGQRLASSLDAELIAAYVHPYGDLAGLFPGGSSSEALQLMQEVADADHAFVRQLTSELKIGDLRLTSASSAAAGLQTLAAESNAGLIVVGSSSRAGLERVMPGGTAQRLLSGSPVAVAVAPSSYSLSDRGLQELGCGYDGSPTAREALRWAADLARVTGARLRVLAVHRERALGTFGSGSVAAELQVRLDQTVAELDEDLRVEAALLEGVPAQVLSEYSEAFDLLVLGSRGWGPLRSVLLGSVSTEVIGASACAVVVVPGGADAGPTFSDPGEPTS